MVLVIVSMTVRAKDGGRQRHIFLVDRGVAG